MNDHESTKRVLYHLVHCYQTWRTGDGCTLGVPNEFTDDAVRIGEQHLREVDWFPQDEGWLREDEHEPLSYSVDQLKPTGSPLELIDTELKRLREPISDEGTIYMRTWKRKLWREGVRAAREVAAIQLQQIRDAYVVEQFTRDTETRRRYGIEQDKSND